MNKPWSRKPREEIEFKDHKIEDLFLCNTCNKWFPWFKYTKGCKCAEFREEDRYRLLNDDIDRGGRKWSCDYCIDKILYNNKIITITNEQGKIINIII